MKRKKILLLNLPGRETYIRDCYCSHIAKAAYVWQPLDLVILSGVLTRNFDLIVFDAIAQKLNLQEILQAINKEEIYACICLIGNISFNEDVQNLKRLKKAKPKAKLLVLGDAVLRYSENLIKKFPFIDACILDFTSTDYLKLLENHKDIKTNKIINNLIYKSGHQIIKGKRVSSQKLFEYPIPKHELFPIKLYRLPMQKFFPFISLITSDGCPYGCKFCPSSIQILGFRLRKIENVIRELNYIHARGIKELRFRDNTFISKREYSVKLLEIMIRKGYNFSYSCLTRIDTVDEKILLLMKKSGCHTIQFGVESGNNMILKKYNKRTNIAQIKTVFAICNKLKINTLAHFILGLPGETTASLQQTLDLAKEINPDYVSFNIAQALWGTQLRKECLKKKLCNKNSVIINTADLSFNTLAAFQKKAYRDFYLRPNYMIKRMQKISSLVELISNFKNMVNLFSLK